jgi:hypothetical protein
MAATTISAILERFETVLVAAPLNYTLTDQPFSDEMTPGTMVDQMVRVNSGGLVNSRITSGNQEVRLDRITVQVQRTLKFEGYDEQRALQDVLDEIERAVRADGPDNFYNASIEKGSRKAVRRKDSDVVEASLNFIVDYDWSGV